MFLETGFQNDIRENFEMASRSVYKISTVEAKKISLNEKQAMEIFWKKYCENIRDPLTLIVKCHLFIENLVDDILLSALPGDVKLLRRYSFARKCQLLEFLGLCHSKEMLKRIDRINQIRNDFVHDLDTSLKKADISFLTKGLEINEQGSEFEKLVSVFHYVIGYLHGLRAARRLFPFISLCLVHKKFLENDDGYLFCKDRIKELYPDVEEILKAMELPSESD